MSSDESLNARLRIVTPVFCAGADQNGPSEIRPFSIRGALRWWYRAIDANFQQKEPLIFGATTGNGRSSPIALQLANWISGDASLEDKLAPKRPRESGVAYLGYTLYLLGKNNRKAVCSDKGPVELQLRWTWKPKSPGDQQYIRRAWAASLWLFGHLGGLGTRARRGYGTLALESWNGWEETKALPSAHGANSPEEWKRRFEAGFRQIRQWFQPPQSALHQHLGAELDVHLWKQGWSSWDQALDAVGKNFRGFRNSEEVHKPELLAAFGLPIRFRNHPARSAQPAQYNRAASLLQIRVVQIGDKFHPLVWGAKGPLVPDAMLKLRYQGHYSQQPPEDWHRALKEYLQHIQPLCV